MQQATIGTNSRLKKIGGIKNGKKVHGGRGNEAVHERPEVSI